jgi:hypothetical protein
MIKIREAISRVRHKVKAVKQDAFLTDRFIFSLLQKHAAMLMRRQDSLNRIMRFNSIFQVLDFVELVEVDRVQAGCVGLSSGCVIKRTKTKLPALMDGYWGPFIRAVTSLDISQELQLTEPTMYERLHKQKTFRYNKKRYYWYLDGHLYFPNLDWDAVRLEGIFHEDVSRYNCDVSDDCRYVQDHNFNIPEFLFTELEQLVDRDLGIQMQLPVDQQHDNLHVIR